MHLLYLIFFLRPFPHLLVLHQSTPHVEASLVRNGRQSILKPSTLAVQLNVVEHIDCCGQSVAIRKMLKTQYLWFIAFSVNFFGRVGVSLAVRFPVIRLNLYLFSCCLTRGKVTSMTSSTTLGWKFSWEIYCTGGARWRGTSLMVATRGFLTKSSLG